MPVDETSQVVELELLNDNGESGDDGETTDATLIGRVEGDLARRDHRVEFDLWYDVNSPDFTPDASVQVLDDGTFIFNVVNLTGTGASVSGPFPV